MASVTKGLVGVEDMQWQNGGDSTFTRPSSSGRSVTLNKMPVALLSQLGTIAEAASKIGSTELELWVDCDRSLTENVTFPSTTTLKFLQGNTIATTGYTLTINGPIEAGPWQIFAGTGTVTFGSGREIHANWFYDGSDGDGAFQSAVTSLAGVGGTIRCEGETYAFNASVELDNTVYGSDTDGETPLLRIVGKGRSSIIQATAGSLSCFLETGGSGVDRPNVFFEDLRFDGNGQTTVNAINISGPGKQSGMRRVWINDFDTTGVNLEHNGETSNPSNFLVDSCKIWGNGVNFQAEDKDTTTYTLYGITFINSTFSLATGTGAAGMGIHLKHIKDVVFINCVVQSNGMSGASYGYGYGVKLDECRYVYSAGKLHLEDHDNDATAQDLVITGSASYPSAYIRLAGTIKKATLAFCNDTVIDSTNLGTVTDDNTARYTLINRDNDEEDGRIDVTHTKYEHYNYDDGAQGRIQNYVTKRINDESHIISPWLMTGSIGNYCEFTDDITASGTWAATNCTKSAAQRVGPHGLTDNSVTDLDATAASGRIQQQAETTWNGWKTFVVWMINISGSGTVNLRLRNSSGEVEPGLCTLSSDWRPYAVTGNDTSTDAVTVRIELSDNSDNIAIWNPILRDGILPGPGLINDSTSAISDENALVFPGGAYFGWEKVGRVFTATHNWNPGSVADGGIVTDTDTVAKAALGDFVEVAPAVDIGDLQLYGHVSAANTVKLYLINNSGGAIDPNGGAAFDVYIRVWERP